MVNEKDYWEGNVTPEEFEEGLEKYGYEYTPSVSKSEPKIAPLGGCYNYKKLAEEGLIDDAIPEQKEYAKKVKEVVGEDPLYNQQTWKGFGVAADTQETREVYKMAGAQIPVGTNIQVNKKEIFKAIDWAKENNVDHLLTPEGSLSGWLGGWENKLDELTDALREVEAHQKKAGVALHLGTNFFETEYFGSKVFRNEIRHYKSNGRLACCTYKSLVLDRQASHPNPPLENVLKRDKDDPVVMVRLSHDDTPVANSDEWWQEPLAAGLICNDLWGYQEGGQRPLTSIFNQMGCFNIIFHATNGRKGKEEDYDWQIFDKWHDAFFHMTSFNTSLPILTVDACTDWMWDGDEDAVEDCVTSSQSGVMTYNGWDVTVPRKGRQYFSWDLKIPKLGDTYTFGDGKPDEGFTYADTGINK